MYEKSTLYRVLKHFDTQRPAQFGRETWLKHSLSVESQSNSKFISYSKLMPLPLQASQEPWIPPQEHISAVPDHQAK